MKRQTKAVVEGMEAVLTEKQIIEFATKYGRENFNWQQVADLVREKNFVKDSKEISTSANRKKNKISKTKAYNLEHKKMP